MKGSWLATYWIKSPIFHSPIGFGVTAFTLEEAIRTIQSEGFGRYLPDNLDELIVRENISINDLDQNNVVPNIGPMVMRGLWYPCLNIGWTRRYE
jgi:hypothetical protein